MDGGDWWATVHGVTKSQTRLSDFTFTFTWILDLTIQSLQPISFLLLFFFLTGETLTDILSLKLEQNNTLLMYSYLENPMNSMKRQKDMTLKDELPSQ